MNITLEKDAIVICVGAIGVGKTTFCAKHFNPVDIVSYDHIQQELRDSHTNRPPMSRPVLRVLDAIIEARAEQGLFTIVDSVGLQPVLDYGKKHAMENGRPLYAFIFPHLNDEEITEERMKHRWDSLNVYYKQVEKINNMDVSDDFVPIVIPKRGRDQIMIQYLEPNHRHIVDPNFNYYVIPDLHGEYRHLSEYESKLTEKDRIIQLGDLVDRGESSFQTFCLTKKMRDKGQLINVKSNHDDKLSRYFDKWLKDRKREKFLSLTEFDEVPSYGMKIGNGLEVTLREFYSLAAKTMEWYAEEFIAMYTSAAEYLVMYREDEVHYFAHAGINVNLLLGNKPKKSDLPYYIYQSVDSAEQLFELWEQTGLEQDVSVYLHVGHKYKYDSVHIESYENCFLVNHDIGIGKVPVDPERKFMYLESAG